MKGTNKIIKAMRYGIYLQYCVVSNWGNVMIHEFLRQVSGYQQDYVYKPMYNEPFIILQCDE